MSESGNNSVSGSDQSGDSPSGTRYNGYARGYSSRGYHRGGGGGAAAGAGSGRYTSYSNGENSYPPYQYRGGDFYYGSRYHAGRGGSSGGTSYHSSRGGGNYGGHRYSHSYAQECNKPYYRGSNNVGPAHRTHDSDGRRYSVNSNSRYHGNRRSEPWGGAVEPVPSQGPPIYGSGNNTPVDSYHRIQPTTASKSEGTPSSYGVTSGTAPAVPIKRRVDKSESPFLYLTDLDKSADDPQQLENIREVLKESDKLDKALEEHNFQLLKNELELGLLATQYEKDTLSVRLTQEKLDTFLMQSS